MTKREKSIIDTILADIGLESLHTDSIKREPKTESLRIAKIH